MWDQIEDRILAAFQADHFPDVPFVAHHALADAGACDAQPLYTQFGAVEFVGAGNSGDFVEVGGEDAAAGHDGDAAGGLQD